MESYYVLVGLGGFAIGYAVGRVDLLRSSLANADGLASSTGHKTVSQSKQALKRVAIDESTYVTKVNDDSLQSSGLSLGKTTTTQDDIGAASIKLASLKKMKG